MLVFGYRGCRNASWLVLSRALLLGFISAGTALGQQASGNATASKSAAPDASDIEILELKWKREVRLPRNFDPSVIPTGNVFNDPTTRTSGGTGAADANRGGNNSRTASDAAFPATPSRLPVFYVYSLKLKNNGPRVIAGVAWDYVFIDPNLNAEVGRHQFLSYAEIPANKTAVLHSDLRSPPIRSIAASAPGNTRHTGYTERAVVQCVLYQDESVWKSPTSSNGICEFLKQNRALIKRKHGANQRPQG